MNITKNTSGETFTITEDWGKLAKYLKEKFPELSDADLKFETGGEDDLLQRLTTKLNKSRGEVITVIRNGQSPGLKFLRVK